MYRQIQTSALKENTNTKKKGLKRKLDSGESIFDQDEKKIRMAFLRDKITGIGPPAELPLFTVRLGRSDRYIGVWTG